VVCGPAQQRFPGRHSDRAVLSARMFEAIADDDSSVEGD
jgi:hypothetical protein